MRGRMEFVALGQRRELRFGNNTFCAIESHFAKPWGEIAVELGGDAFSFRAFRSLFRIALSGCDADEDAGDVIDAIGMGEALRLVREGIQSALPQAAQDAASGEEPASAQGGGSTGTI